MENFIFASFKGQSRCLLFQIKKNDSNLSGAHSCNVVVTGLSNVLYRFYLHLTVYQRIETFTVVAFSKCYYNALECFSQNMTVPFSFEGRTRVFYRGRSYQFLRKQEYVINFRGLERPILNLWLFVRGKFRPMRRKRRNWVIRIGRRWRRVIKGRITWYYKLNARWMKIRRVRLRTRVGGRTRPIQIRRRRMYVRIGRSFKRIRPKFKRFIRYRKRLLTVRRTGRRVVIRRGRGWSRPLRVRRRCELM